MLGDKRIMMVWLKSAGRGCAVFLLSLPLLAHAEKFCLLMAENYYEQLYCELKALGQGKQLPAFYDFQKNNEVTQALLLKRPAEKAGIKLALPQKSEALRGLPSPPLFPSVASGRQDESHSRDTADSNSQLSSPLPHSLAQCIFHPTQVLCGDERFQLVGNLKNNRLREGALAPSNKMNIPVYQGSEADASALGRYLSKAYAQYVEKMLEIGLGGSTFSYAKFVYLYNDVTAKGIDFSGRFETMFGYLKQDKKNLAVSERVSPTSAPMPQQCARLADHLLVCDAGRKNHLFLRQH